MRLATRRLTVIFFATAALLGVAMYLTYNLSRYAARSQDDVLRTYEALRATRAVLVLVQDAETGQRGYILTRQGDYLKPYNDALAALPGAIAEMKAQASVNDYQSAKAAELESAIRAELDELDKSIGVARTEGFDAARALVLTDAGKRAMDRIRTQVDELLAAQRAELTRRIATTDQAETETLLVATVGGLIALIALVTASLSLARNYRRLRRAEIALSEKTVVLQATLDNVRDGIAVFGRDLSLVASNERFFRMFEIPSGARRERRKLTELSTGDGRALDVLLSPPPSGAAAGAYTDSSGGTLFQIAHAGRDIEVYRNAMPDGGLIVACADITRRTRAEAMVRQTQKMEAIGHLTGGVAHDFNNLLQVIRTNLDLLAGDVAGNARAEERLANALTGTVRGARLTQQLLAFARRQPLAPVVINLGRLVGDMTDMLRRTLGETVEIETIVGGGLWNTLVDPSQVENAVLNLAINARDAMPKGGKLTIELANSFLDEAYAAEHSEVTPGQYVMLAVTDTGTGMTPEVMAHAFEPFYTTKGEGQGTGLGLSMVFGFVKQSDGHAKIYSEPGQGTTVKLYLPRSRRPEERATARPLARAAGGSETILVVEDDAAVRRATVEILGDLGYRVLEAEDGESAFARLAEHGPVDLLFTDVVMPGTMSSRELARQAQARYPGLAVLFTSGYTENAIIHHGRLDDDVLLISKPYGKDELAHKVRSALATARRATPASRGDGADRRAAPAAPIRLERAAAARPGALTVLLVEDEPLIRLATIDQLEELGHRAIGTATAKEALRVLEERDDVDVLLTDLGLPGMNGGELAVEARRRKPALHVVIASGRTSPVDGSLAALTDAIHLNKPYLVEELRRALAGASRP
jgi:signal transduction histidine kinase/CHASE3 domain sensor protein/DNA-binding NarL/FixJ family response regulator